MVHHQQHCKGSVVCMHLSLLKASKISFHKSMIFLLCCNPKSLYYLLCFNSRVKNILCTIRKYLLGMRMSLCLFVGNPTCTYYDECVFVCLAEVNDAWQCMAGHGWVLGMLCISSSYSFQPQQCGHSYPTATQIHETHSHTKHTHHIDYICETNCESAFPLLSARSLIIVNRRKWLFLPHGQRNGFGFWYIYLSCSLFTRLLNASLCADDLSLYAWLLSFIRSIIYICSLLSIFAHLPSFTST